MVYVTDIVSSAGSVLLVGMLLFAISGVWPPLVAIESPSMDPHIKEGDLVFVMDEDRFSGPADHHGVVTAANGDSYRKFQHPGDVIVYKPDGNGRQTPIIHRAMLWVEADENWYDRANENYIGSANNCEQLTSCPADHAGFITKGDNNGRYDQVGTTPISDPVKPGWVVGTAELRVPLLGQVRLQWNRAGATAPATNETGPTATNGTELTVTNETGTAAVNTTVAG
ncbi:S26 family signal peptidase [Haloarcula mannanilytica]|uniref:S26 family signal peptidase n=1 Tax=Haloarcula mannanilytica TaxID=2509225 RepID=UPI0010FA2FEC|nr:S26 family signal peptidase [Haloarcula mannanilytica]